MPAAHVVAVEFRGGPEHRADVRVKDSGPQKNSRTPTSDSDGIRASAASR